MKTMASASVAKRVEQARCKELMRDFLLAYRDWMEEALRREKLTLPQLRMLHAVEQGSEESAAAIARACQVTPQTLQAMLERAVREKWIVRRPSERSLRILTASLTPKGRAILERGKQLSEELGLRMWAGVDTAALKQCNGVLEQGLANLQAIAAGEK